MPSSPPTNRSAPHDHAPEPQAPSQWLGFVSALGVIIATLAAVFAVGYGILYLVAGLVVANHYG